MMNKWINRCFLLLSVLFITSGMYAQVVINEVLVSPPVYSGSTTNANSLYNVGPADQPPFNCEWIELYNCHPCDTADLSCYTLGSNMQPPPGSSYSNWGAFTFPLGTKIPPLGFLVIGGNASQVPLLNFNMGYYRNTFFKTQYLDGDSLRWFLRDEFGWIALYSSSGAPVDAVYWDLYGNPGNLYAQEEYAHDVVTTTSCSGTMTLPAAKNIPGIEYVGMTSSGSYLSFQRTTDGINNWFSTPVTPTPGGCNSNFVGPQQVNCSVSGVSCAGGGANITVHITSGGTGPYTTHWIQPSSGGNQQTLTNLDSGTYIVKVSDAFNCFVVYDTVTVPWYTPPVISISLAGEDTCNASKGFLQTQTIGGKSPFSYSWNSNPVQTTANLHNVTAGNYTVTVTDADGCTAKTSAVITDTPPPRISFPDVNDETCNMHNGSVSLHISGGSPPYSFVWEQFPSNQDTVLNHLSEGSYNVMVTDQFCTDSAKVSIANIPGPVAAFRVYPQATTIEYPRIVFYDESTGATEWNWDFGDLIYSTDKSPVHHYADTGTFHVSLVIHDKNGCMDSVSHNALILDYITLFVPNAFTPNADNLNDEFRATGENIGDFEIYIFDRWGEEVFHSTSMDKGWDGTFDGKSAPEGTYCWIILYKENYRLFRMNTKKIKGHVTLIR